MAHGRGDLSRLGQESAGRARGANHARWGFGRVEYENVEREERMTDVVLVASERRRSADRSAEPGARSEVTHVRVEDLAEVVHGCGCAVVESSVDVKERQKEG